MRVIVIGAQGEIGRSVLLGLAGHKEISHVIALFDSGASPAGSASEIEGSAIERRTVDLLGDVQTQLRFADAVIYLGGPHRENPTVPSSQRQRDILSHLCQSVGAVGVRVFVYVSSAWVYAPARAGERVDEAWTTSGANSSRRACLAVDSELLLDGLETDHPLIRVVRLRPAMIVCPSAPKSRWRINLLKRLWVVANTLRQGPLLPNVEPLSIQCIHISDLVGALCLGLTRSVAGSFNVAAEPMTSALLAAHIGARQIRIPPHSLLRLLRFGARMRLISLPADRIELALDAPDMDTTRAQGELGWVARHPAPSILDEWLTCLRPDSCGTPIGESPVRAGGLDLYSLYGASLEYFSRAVHAVRDEQWHDGTEVHGLCVWQLVAAVARAQYRLAFTVRGYDETRN